MDDDEVVHTTYTDNDLWRFRNRRSGYEPAPGPACWRWEISGDPISDNYSPDEIDAVDLLKRWLERSYPDHTTESLYGPGMVGIYWFVDIAGMFETADCTADVYRHDDETFLTHFTQPRHTDTDETINWNRVPVADKLWDQGHADKGGFFLTATGWRPSPLQPAVYVPGVLRAAGLGHLLSYNPRTREKKQLPAR